MIEITSVRRNPVTIRTYSEPMPITIGYRLEVSFILFSIIVCSCEFETQDLELDIKSHIESQLKEDFNSNALQLEGKPSNLKTK